MKFGVAEENSFLDSCARWPMSPPRPSRILAISVLITPFVFSRSPFPSGLYGAATLGLIPKFCLAETKGAFLNSRSLSDKVISGMPYWKKNIARHRARNCAGGLIGERIRRGELGKVVNQDWEISVARVA